MASPGLSSEVPCIVESRVGGYVVTNNPALLDSTRIHAVLTKIYWSEGVGRAAVERSLRHSFNIGVYGDDGQVALTRIITDYTTFAYLTDVYVEVVHQGKGLAAAMVRFALDHPDLQNLRRFLLVSRDAKGLYERFGFADPKHPERIMELLPARRVSA